MKCPVTQPGVHPPGTPGVLSQHRHAADHQLPAGIGAPDHSSPLLIQLGQPKPSNAHRIQVHVPPQKHRSSLRMRPVESPRITDLQPADGLVQVRTPAPEQQVVVVLINTKA